MTALSAAAFARFEASFAKTHGADVLRRSTKVAKYDVIPTGSVELDWAMGVGGYVQGRIIEIWGSEGVGKTTLSLIAAANAMRVDATRAVGFVDMEQTLDLAWARKHGVDLDRLYHVQPESAETTADVTKSLLDSGLMSLVIVDSIGGMVTRPEFEKGAEDAVVAANAKIVTRMVNIASSLASQHNTTVIIINQVRANLGYGADTTTGGGFALKHATTHKLHVKKAGLPVIIGSNENKREIGQPLAVWVEKNKVAPPKMVAKVTLLNQNTEQYGPLGIDRGYEAFHLGKRLGLLGRKTGIYELPDGSSHKGEEKALEHLRAHGGAIDEIRKRALAMVEDQIVADEFKEG